MARYKLRYSPLFYEDLSAIIDYILYDLKNAHAAKNLISSTESAIMKRLNSPLSAPPYASITNRQVKYRRILVGNYLVLYVVKDDSTIVRRILYGRRDMEKIL